MACFKTKQYQVLSGVIHRQMAKFAQMPKQSQTDRTIAVVMNMFVNELCREFAKDNPRFNETLFRVQCGNAISKQLVTSKETANYTGYR